MEENNNLTPEEIIQELSDTLIASAMQKDDISKSNRRSLFGTVNEKIFRDENYIIYNILYSFKDKGITPDAEFVKMYLSRQRKFIKESEQYINLKAYADLDEDPIVAYIAAVLKQFVRLSGFSVLSADEFDLSLEKYKIEFSSYEMSKTYSQAKIILYDGMHVGRRYYQGYEDSVAFVKSKNAELESILNKSAGEGFVDSRIEGIKDKERLKSEKIGDFGLVTELNEYIGGYYTGLFYSIIAPTKGGKSKWSAAAAHNIAVEFGNNISIWGVEGGYELWWEELRAIHFERTYIRNRSDGQRVAPISQREIHTDVYPSEAIKSLEAASRLDLFTNPNYGNFSMIDRPFTLETFIDDIDTSVQLNGSKCLIIDYLQMVEWETRNLTEREAIKQAYQKLLRYCRTHNICVISPAQFSQEFIKELSASSKSGKTAEARTGGGNSAEVVRTPDINIGLYASIEDLGRKEMQILSIPSRFVEPFEPIPIYADLCSCVFASVGEAS